jgi:hypothetical protein
MASNPNKLESFFWHLQDLYHELKPCRFAIIVTAVGALIFLRVDEGTEVLRAMAEPGSVAGLPNWVRWSACYAGLFIWCMANWYSARVLLYFDFPAGQEWHPRRTGLWKSIHGWVRAQLPRILGAAPMWVVGASLLNALRTYERTTSAWPWLLGFGILCIVSGFVIWGALIIRRRLLDGSQAVVQPAHQRGANSLDVRYRSLSELEPGTKRALLLIAALCLVAFVAFSIHPLFLADKIGTGAVLMLAAASWVFAGSALVYWGSWRRLPIVTFLVVWVALCSLNNDNHRVRTLPREKFERVPISKAFTEWDAYITRKYPNRAVHPLYIVTTEGGGIRAAYWTATVLGALQDHDPSFADHVFAISGVSGGSVGAAVFDALVADGTKTGEFAKRGQEILGVDFLSPAMAAMLYPDFLQRFIPFPIPYFDRGSWLEKAWEKAWRETSAKHGGHATNRLAEPFLDLWQKKSVAYVPALFLNGTSVEVGNRLIASNLLIDGSFLDAEDATGKLLPEKRHDERRHPQIDMPLSTTAHNSARFTYVSPAGRFDEDGSHVVDGGYFENSGAATGLDILRELEKELCRDKNGSLGLVVPKIIMISNDPLGIASGSRKMSQTKGTLHEAKQHRPGTFLVDTLAPLQTLFSTREARGSYAQREITLEQQNVCDTVAHSLSVGRMDQKGVYFFSLAPATVPLPLGWMLSNGAAKAMQDEIYDKGLSSSITNPSTRIWNQVGMTRVIGCLEGTGPTSGSDPGLRPQ